MAYPEYYNVLQISVKASMDEVKKAYRRLAKKYHPDLHPNDKKAENQLKIINEAYAVLGDVAKRAEYDYLGTQSSVVKFTSSTPAKQKTKVSLMRLMFRYTLLLSIMFGYIVVLYHNRDLDNPYNISKAFVNTSEKMINGVINGAQKVLDVYQKETWKIYAWEYALRNNNLYLANKFSALWPECNVTDEKGYNLLMLTNKTDMAQILLDSGCDVNYVAPDGETPYSRAAKSKNINMLQWLRIHGAKISAK